jgi:proteasome lid subunit RPN8/RPN11
LPVCYHCGREVSETFLCVECAENYCALHLDKVVHECNLVKEFGSMSLDLSDYQHIESDILNFDLPVKYDDFQDKSPELQLQIKQFHFLEESGWIELDPTIIKNSVRMVIESQLDMRQDEKFKDFLKKNYCGKKLYENIQLFSRKSLIQDLSLWFGSIEYGGSDNFHELINYSGCFRDLLLKHFLYLRDCSYLESIPIMDIYTNKKERVEVTRRGEINIGRITLTKISETVRESEEKECVGILIGERKSDGTIIEINEYFPIGKGSTTMAQISSEDFINLLSRHKNIEYELVGWYHSHPKSGAPTFSMADRLTHKNLTFAFSIFNFFKRFKKKIPNEQLFHFGMNLGLFSKQQIELIMDLLSRANLRAVIFSKLNKWIQDYIKTQYFKIGIDISQEPVHLSVKSYIELYKLIEMNFKQLTKNLDSLINKLAKYGPKKKFTFLPFLGMVICPSRRYISIMDVAQVITFKEIKNADIHYFKLNLTPD